MTGRDHDLWIVRDHNGQGDAVVCVSCVRDDDRRIRVHYLLTGQEQIAHAYELYNDLCVLVVEGAIVRLEKLTHERRTTLNFQEYRRLERHESDLEKRKLLAGQEARESEGEDVNAVTFHFERLQVIGQRIYELLLKRKRRKKASVDADPEPLDTDDSRRLLQYQNALQEAQVSLYALENNDAFFVRVATKLRQASSIFGKPDDEARSRRPWWRFESGGLEPPVACE